MTIVHSFSNDDYYGRRPILLLTVTFELNKSNKIVCVQLNGEWDIQHCAVDYKEREKDRVIVGYNIRVIVITQSPWVVMMRFPFQSELAF